jgi:hypothetical protein
LTDTHALWAAQVAAATDLPDLRLEARLAQIFQTTIERPSDSIPQAAGDWGQTQATYRFLANPRVTAAALRQGIGRDTAQRCRDHDVVLLPHDTTSLNFTPLHAIPELGPIDSGQLARGVLLHTTLAVTAPGRVLGILAQQYWARPPAERPTPRPPDQKESGKWIEGIELARAALHQAFAGRPRPRCIHVMDREGDVYEVLQWIDDVGDSAIIRCVQDRRVAGPCGTAHPAVRDQPSLGRVWLTVPRTAGRAARQAVVELRSLPCSLRPDREKYPHAWPMDWMLVEVREPQPPPGVEPLHWLLWTREPAETLDEVLEVLRQYTCRWPIEEFHLTLKSGCRVEALRLETWDRLEKAVMIESAVAARIVALRDRAREEPEAPAQELLNEDEVAVLVAKFGKGMAVSELSLGQAVLWIGRLGGHLNRKGDGTPGVRTLWRGLHDLAMLVEGFRAARHLRE